MKNKEEFLKALREDEDFATEIMEVLLEFLEVDVVTKTPGFYSSTEQSEIVLTCGETKKISNGSFTHNVDHSKNCDW